MYVVLLLLGYMVTTAFPKDTYSDYSQSCSDKSEFNIRQNAYGNGFLPNDSGMECPPGLFFVTTGHVSVLTIIILMTSSSVMKKRALLSSWIATVPHSMTTS